MAILELAPEDGEHIGPYRIVRLLGRGGMGEVFLGWDPDLQRSVAIKRIRPDSELGPTLRQRLLREAQTAGSLHHPSIVIVYHLLKCAGDDCIVMEYVQGQTLAEALRDGPLELARAVGLAKEVAAGLAVAHAAGIIHRDLKAENVMITPAQDAKILDFGLAKPMGIKAVDPALTATGHVVGTRRSMSPEQLRGAEVDGRSDLFSLGVLLYEMLTGSSPFQGVNAPAILCQMFRSGAPPRLVALLERLLAQDPAARFQTAGEVLRELEAIAAALSPPSPESEETLSALPTEAMGRWGGSRPSVDPSVPALVAEKTYKPRRRRRQEIAILLSLAVAIVAMSFFLWNRRFDKQLIWVVVTNPQVAGQDAKTQRAASALVMASLKVLGSLQGIAPIGPVTRLPKSSPGVTTDVLTATFEGSGDRRDITLCRTHGTSGKCSWTITFMAPIDEKGFHTIENKLLLVLPDAFTDHHPRTDVSPGDYATFFRIKAHNDEGQDLSASDMSALQKIAKRSPAFLEAPLLEADVLTKNDNKRALQLVKNAQLFAPGDPRPLQSEFWIDLHNHRFHEANKILTRLTKLRNDNPQIPLLQARLASDQDQPAEARLAWKQAVAYIPSWRNLLGMAKVEEELGMASEARDHLDQILADSPRNVYAQQQLAELELYYGDPARAEKIYLDLIKTSRIGRFYSNLGTARVLLHHYTDAAEAFGEALNIEPGNDEASLNLGDTELALGKKDEADKLYRKILKHRKSNHQKNAAADDDDTVEAQCLAHLGNRTTALIIAQNALRNDPDQLDTAVSAALVFTLGGDYGSAKATIRKALAKHIAPIWFKLPSFAPLFEEPAFQQLMNEATAGQMPR